MIRDKKYALLSSVLVLSQMMTQGVCAEEISYSGTTQISTDSCFLDLSTFSVELVVEEVYVSAGDTVSKGDKLFKFTDDSYQKALDYYQASIIRAENTLTDTQREYDNGILESKSTYDIALADAENAEFIRDYQSAEVENALQDHAEILEDIDERIEELYEGIDAGSYDSSTGGASGGSSSGGSSSASGGNKTNAQKESETETKQSEPSTKPETETEQSEPLTEPSTESAEADSPAESEQTEPPIKDEQEQPGGDTPGQEEENTSDAETLRKQIQEKEAELRSKEASLQTTLDEVLQSIVTEEDDITSDYSTYSEQLKNIIAQLETDLTYQKSVKDMFSEDNSEEKAVLEKSIEGDENVLASLKEIQEKLEKYSSLLGTLLKLFPAEEGQTVMLETETVKSITDYMDQVVELTGLYSQFVTLYETNIDSLKKQIEEEQKKNEAQNGGSPSQGGQPSGGEMPSYGTPSTESEKTSGQGQIPGGYVPNGTDAPNTSGVPDMSGFSGGGASGMDSSSVNGPTAMSGESGAMGQGMMNGTAALDGSAISILGSTYDLSNTKELLEREPSDSDAAYDLIDELYDSQENIREQYEELLRNEAVYDLQIQYTYDEAILSGKLAEITYKQELEEWENTLQSAKDEKTSLEKEQEVLENYTDGIFSSDRDGILAAVNYEAEDKVNPMTAMVSYYQTDVVTIDLQVPQEEIAMIQVGDPVDVAILARGTYEGIVSEKAIDPDSDTSRTEVNYTVTVSVDNEDGKISSGAAVTVSLKNEMGEENDEE